MSLASWNLIMALANAVFIFFKIPISASDQRLGFTEISVGVAAYAAVLVVFVGAFA
jgi:hypothetical protein